MTNHSTAFGFTSQEDWQKLQQQYWEHWLTITQQLFNLPASLLKNMSPSSPWGEALELWWQTLAPSVCDEHHAVFKKFIDQGKIYFGFNQEFLKVLETLSNNQATAISADNWPQLWEKSFVDFQESFERLITEGKSGLGLWELPLEGWQQGLSAWLNLSGDFWQHLQTDALKNGQQWIPQELERWFSLPGLGYLQSWQTRFQERTKLWINYQQAYEKYISAFNKVGVLTVELLRDKILQLGIQGQSVENLRSVYDLWIDCGESAYAKVVSSDEFREINANLINTLMALKQHERQWIDELLGALNLPTHKEFDTLIHRMQQMRRELRARPVVPAATENSVALATLHKEIEALRADLNMLKNPPKKTPSRKKTPPKPTKKNTPPSLDSSKK